MFRISSYTYLLGWFDVLRHVPSWLQTFVANLSEKKFIPEKKNFPQLKGRAVEVRALTEPLLKLWCEKMDGTQRADVLLKMVLERSHEFDELLHQHVDLPCLPPLEARLKPGIRYRCLL